MPNLAISLRALGDVLTRVKRHDAAAVAYQEGLSMIAPFVERHIQAFGEFATALSKNYLAACKAAGIEAELVAA